MNAIEKLRAIQEEELNNNFPNGDLWNELESLIWKIENPQSEVESGDFNEKSSTSHY